jgi:hypothetical protein
VPVAGPLHIEVSHMQVVASQSSVPVPAPTLSQVAPPRFFGSHGVLPMPHANFVPESGVLSTVPPSTKPGC